MSTFKEILDAQFHGVITRRSHQYGTGEACALELLSVKKGLPFTGDPKLVRCFDFRLINDIDVSDELRTEWMLPMLEAYEDSMDWDEAKQKRVVERIIISTVNQLITCLPGLSIEVISVCKAVKTLEEARTVADAVSHIREVRFNMDADIAITYFFGVADYIIRATVSPATGADGAARCAFYVAAAVSEATPYFKEFENIFITACKIWLEAAKDDT